MFLSTGSFFILTLLFPGSLPNTCAGEIVQRGDLAQPREDCTGVKCEQLM